jgi:hypothetical protein
MSLAIQESGIPFANFIIFSIETNCAWGGVRTSNLLEEPYRAQNDASAFLAMDPDGWMNGSTTKWMVDQSYLKRADY